MGDPKEVGTLLNKQHNPFWGGWILRISNGIIIFFIVIDIFFVGGLVLHSIFSGNMVKDIPKEDIVYRIDIKEKVKIDDRVIRFTNVVYDKSGNMNIFYEYYDLRSLGSGWSLGYIGDIMDNLGNTYLNGSGSSYGGGIVSRGRITVDDFSKDADTLIINYDRYNRKYRVEVPLKAGDANE